jgi:hypothetical protein
MACQNDNIPVTLVFRFKIRFLGVITGISPTQTLWRRSMTFFQTWDISNMDIFTNVRRHLKQETM